MDADGSHAPEQLPRLLGALSHADVVLGARYVPGGAVVNWPKSREFISRGGNLYSRLALGVPLHDITGGYRAYKAEVLRALKLDEIASHGYCFQIDVAWRAIRAGFTVAEVPITFTERTLGESKMSGSIVREAFSRSASGACATGGNRCATWSPASPEPRPHGVTGARLGRRGSTPIGTQGPGADEGRRPRVGAAPFGLSRSEPASGGRAPRLDLGQALVEDLFEFFDGATLEQHVPVGPRRLDRLGFRHRAVDQRGLQAVHPAVPGRGHLGVVGERDGEFVVARAR